MAESSVGMMFRSVCAVLAGLAFLSGLGFYLLPWLLTLPMIAMSVEMDAWHDGHSIFSRSAALVILFAALLLWGIRTLPGEASQIAVSAGLSIGSVFVAALIAYLVLSGFAAEKIQSLASSDSANTVASVQSAIATPVAQVSNMLVWLIAGLIGIVGVTFGVNIMPGGKSDRKRRRVSGAS